MLNAKFSRARWTILVGAWKRVAVRVMCSMEAQLEVSQRERVLATGRESMPVAF